MRSAKGFLIAYAAVYFLVAIGLNLWLGPPTMSAEYLETYKRDHDRYIEVGKDPVYKKWEQRPQLNEPGPELASDIAFVEEYESRPEFQAEMVRRGRYDILFDVFNVAMLLLLALRFGWKPLLRLLDDMREAVGRRIERAQEAARLAAERQKAAWGKINSVPAEQAALEESMRTRIEEMRHEAALQGAQSLSALNRETEDRKRHETTLAKQALKQELVDQSLADVERQIREGDAAALQHAMLGTFMAGLDARKTAR